MPKLKKGQMASGIKARSNATVESVRRRIVLFEKLRVHANPSKEIVSHFTTLERLAAWNDGQYGISRVSPKTLRKHLGSCYCGGALQFKQDVANLILVFGKTVVSPKSISRSNATIKNRLSEATDAVLEMSGRYLDLLERLRKLAKSHEGADSELLRHLRKFGDVAPHLRVIK